MKNSKKSVILSASLVIMLCVSILVSGTFAWFTDKATVSVNKVQAGKLDVTLNMRNNPDEEWAPAEGKTLSFLRMGEDGKLVVPAEDDPVLWEPGATYKLPELQIENKGNLAFKYKVVLSGATGDTELLDVINFTSQVTKADGTLSEAQNAFGAEVICEGWLKPDETYQTIYLQGHMSVYAGNEYQGKLVENVAVTVYATQVPYEVDSENKDYDVEAGFYNFSNVTASVTDDLTSSGSYGVVFADNGAQVTVNANLTAKEGADHYAMAIWADGEGTKVVIEGGEFVQDIFGTDSQYDLIYASGGAVIEIKGGTFMSATPRWTLNCKDRSGSKIIVSGGRFYNFNPAAPNVQPAGTQEIFIADGYMVVSEELADGNVWYTVKEAKDVLGNGGTIDVTSDIVTNNPEDVASARITITEETTLNLDKMIKSPDYMGDNDNNFAALYIEADTVINAGAEGGIDTGIKGGYGININNGATVTINGGYYYGGGTAVQVQLGTLIINDGVFACEPFGEPYGNKFLINCVDSAYVNGTAKVIIKGGTFVNWNPSESYGDLNADRTPANFVAEGYEVVAETKDNGDVWYTVVPV